MKYGLVIISAVLLFLPAIAMGQHPNDDLVSKCVLTAGDNTTYLKDFRVQLPEAAPGTAIPVYKANMYLMKNIKYRFSLCNAPQSKGELVITIYDQGKELISSLSKTTGKKYPSIDFVCNKTGLYTLWYDFVDGKQGSGVGIVCMIR